MHVPLDIRQLFEQFNQSKLLQLYLPLQVLHSKARDRIKYLQRPDLGRQLDEVSISKLLRSPDGRYDLVFVITDGLSSYDISNHVKLFIELFITRLHETHTKIGI